MKRKYGITEFDIYKAKVIGNVKWIYDRYPNDPLLHEHLMNATNGMCSLVNLIIKHNDYLEEFKKEVYR